MQPPVSGWRSALLAALLSLATMFAFLQLNGIHRAQVAAEQRADAVRLASLHAQTMQDEITRALSTSHVITLMLQQFGELRDFAHLAEELMRNSSIISSISVAPQGIVTQTYPETGHTMAIGMNLLDPAAQDAAELSRAISGHHTYYSGVVELANGKPGMVARLPVFIDRDIRPQFWGLISMVTTLDRIERISGLDTLADKGFDFAFGDAALSRPPLMGSTGDWPAEAHLFPLSLPFGEWIIAIAPRRGWGVDTLGPFKLVLELMASLLFGAVFVVWGRENDRLRNEVSRRNHSLIGTNESIRQENEERRIIEQGLRSAEARWRALLEHIPYLLMIHDMEGNILEVNQRTCDALGYSRSQLLARTIGDIDIALRSRSLSDERYGLTPGQAVTSRGEYRRIQSSTFPTEISSGAIETPQGVQIIVLARDLTAQLDAEQALMVANLELEREVEERTAELSNTHNELLEESNDRLRAERQMSLTSELSQRAEQTRSRFIDSITDGIRPPMSQVLAPLAELASLPLEGDAHSHAQHARRSAERLEQLISELLDFSHLESRTLQIQPRETLLFEMLGDIGSTQRMLALGKGLEFRSRVDPRLPAVLMIDPIRVRQILDNLLGNAIKFTAAGSVALELDVVARTADRVTLQIRIRDTGIGIPRQARGRIFEPFTQADSSVTRSFGGTGLGLAISHQLAEAMGGSLALEEQEGPGCCMRLELQAAVVDTAARLPPPLRDRLAGRPAFVAVEDACQRLLLQRLLAEWGAEVRDTDRFPPPGASPDGALWFVELDRPHPDPSAAGDRTVTVVGEGDEPPGDAEGEAAGRPVLRLPADPDALQECLARLLPLSGDEPS